MGLASIVLSLLTASALEIPLYLTESPSVSLSKRVSSVHIENSMNSQYQGTFYFGTPPQPFTFALSTSFNYILLDDISSYPPSDPRLPNKYNKSESSTYEEIDYTDKLASRMSLSSDIFSLCRECGKGHRQHFVLTRLKSYDLDYSNADGLIGFSFDKVQNEFPTLLGNLKIHKVIDKAIVAFYLSDNSHTEIPSSSLSFGSYDLEKYALSDFSYIPVNWRTGTWFLPFNGFALETEELTLHRQAQIDLSYSFIKVSAEIYEMAREFICNHVNCDKGYEGIVFKCENETKLPEMRFKLGEHYFPLSPKYYVERLNPLCRVLIVPSYNYVDILGIPFMRAYYSLFDVENYRIGLARGINYPLLSSLWYIWLGVAVGVLALVGIGVWLIWFFKDRKSIQKKEDLIEPLIRANGE